MKMVEKECNKEKTTIYELLEKDIMASGLPLKEKNQRLSKLITVQNRKVNIMLAGATGSGKSSTINALFQMEVAKVGVGVAPETEEIAKYELDNLIIWDTPGLGDGIKSDETFSRMMVKKLSELDEQGAPLIDLVLVILDASSKDLGTSYDLINNVIIPCLGNHGDGRILIGLNQADMAMKGMHWNTKKNKPDVILTEFLKEKAKSVQKRIQAGTGIKVTPVFYCAGYKETDGEQRNPYNMTKLLYYIIRAIPKEKRLALADNINDDKDNWCYDDEEDNYIEATQKGFFESIADFVAGGAEAGGEIGERLLGVPGKAAGAFVGGIFGAVSGFIHTLFG